MLPNCQLCLRRDLVDWRCFFSPFILLCKDGIKCEPKSKHSIEKIHVHLYVDVGRVKERCKTFLTYFSNAKNWSFFVWTTYTFIEHNWIIICLQWCGWTYSSMYNESPHSQLNIKMSWVAPFDLWIIKNTWFSYVCNKSKSLTRALNIWFIKEAHKSPILGTMKHHNVIFTEKAEYCWESSVQHIFGGVWWVAALLACTASSPSRRYMRNTEYQQTPASHLLCKEFLAMGSNITRHPVITGFYSIDIPEHNSFRFLAFTVNKIVALHWLTLCLSIWPWVCHCSTRGELIKSCCPPQFGRFMVRGRAE